MALLYLDNGRVVRYFCALLTFQETPEICQNSSVNYVDYDNDCVDDVDYNNDCVERLWTMIMIVLICKT